MKSAKHLQKREEIIDTAFRVWNKSYYFSTSLNDIAESLQMTKQAIYRYFKSKNDLIIAMEQRINGEYRKNYEVIRDIMETQSRDEAVKSYIMNQIVFFRDNREYLTFLVSKVRQREGNSTEFLQILAEQNGFISNRFSLPALAVNYILNLIIFYMFMGSGEKAVILTERIFTILFVGFGTALLETPKKPESIIDSNKLIDGQSAQPNKVFQAITDVVLEEGPNDASLDKIARRAGMKKSSLYFYFKNKEEMIVETINGQTEQFINYYHRKLSEYTDIGEQLFAHFVITASMTIEMPRTVTLIHWFVQRGIGDKFRKPTEYEKYRLFFENAANYRYLDTHGVTAEQLLLLVNFCVTFEINNELNKNLDKEEKYRLVYSLFDLFAHGLNGQKKNAGNPLYGDSALLHTRENKK